MTTDRFTQWLTMLAALINPAIPGEALEALLQLRPHLRAEFSAQHLTPEAARAVAEAERFSPVPGWDVIAPALRKHIRENRPATFGRLPAPREPDVPKPTTDEIKRVDQILGDFFASRGRSHQGAT